MLRPPLRIFIAHRDKSVEFDYARQAVEHCQLKGFRIKPVYINDTTLRYSTTFPEEILSELDQSDIALVLLSSDERLSSDNIKIPSLAVMYEWGYLSSVMGRSRNEAIQVLRGPGVEAGEINPSVQYVKMHTDMKEFRDWLASYLRDKWQMVPVQSSHPRIQSKIETGDLGSPSMTERDLMAFFEREIKTMVTTKDAILYIYERVFFDVYFDDKEFWRRHVRHLSARETDTVLRRLLDGLSCILEYTSGLWRNRPAGDLTRNDLSTMHRAYAELSAIDKEMDLSSLDPVYAIAVKNYLGLFGSRDEISSFMPPTRIADAFGNFDCAYEIAKKFEVGTVRLWQGFISANIEKLLTNNASARKEIKHYRENLHSALIHATDVRRSWLSSEVQMPHFLRDIFLSEYFSALKSLSTKYNGNGGRYKKYFDNEFGSWRTSTQAARFLRIKNIFDGDVKEDSSRNDSDKKISSGQASK